MPERMWFFARNNQQEGPIPESQLQALFHNHSLPSETLVWSDHLSNWTPAAQVETFASHAEPQVGAQPAPAQQQPQSFEQSSFDSSLEPALEQQPEWAAAVQQAFQSQATAQSHHQAASEQMHADWNADLSQPGAYNQQPAQPQQSIQHPQIQQQPVYQQEVQQQQPSAGGWGPQDHNPQLAQGGGWGQPESTSAQGWAQPETAQGSGGGWGNNAVQAAQAITTAPAAGWGGEYVSTEAQSESQSQIPAAFMPKGYTAGGFDAKAFDPGGYAPTDMEFQPGGGVTGLGQALATGEIRRDPNEASQSMKTSRSLRKSFGANTAEPEAASAKLITNEPDWKPPSVAEATSNEPVSLTEGEPHPWLRFWARSLDANFALIFGLIFSLPFIGGFVASQNPLWLLVAFFAVFTGFLIYEPICLTKMGATLGKMVIGMEVRNADGTKLNIGDSAKRTWLVFLRSGAICQMIPAIGVAQWVFYAMQFQKLNENRITSWDRDMSIAIRHKPLTAMTVVLIVVSALGQGVVFGGMGFVAARYAQQYADSKNAEAESGDDSATDSSSSAPATE